MTEKSTIEDLRRYLIDRGYDDASFFVNPDFMDAILGISQDGSVVYSFNKMVESLMDSDEMTYNEAIEFIEYNTMRTIPYMGTLRPVIVYDIEF